ncbi:hypothetical protein E2C01_097021 [Portunus trituberculatus]|uniref:Uncharacterized protein n=2 Tax=Portunus trituberculatus TaxID=210409 RepID=A0A5B7K8V2_PORTR|nr:hypothetical protein [Portunus trituberculatus]
MKVGVRLTQLLLQCCCEVTRRVLNRGVLDKLHTLYHKPHMALSMKLLILR